MRGAVAALALWALAAPLAARGEAPLGGVAVGSAIANAVRAIGMPSAVDSTDSGNRFVWTTPNATTTAYVDDDGMVRAVEYAPLAGSVRVDIDGKAKAFPIGAYSAAQADAELASFAELATDATRTYRLSPARELVLAFDAKTQRLVRVAYGERGAIGRIGYLPADQMAKVVPYVAPKLRHSALASGTGAQATIVKYTIDRGGAVTDVAVLVPSSDAAFDTQARTALAGDRFAPATLGGRAIAATVFRELRH